MARIEITIDGYAAARRALEAVPERTTQAMRRAMSESIMRVYRRAALNLTGRILKVQTGRLRQSLQTSVEQNGRSAKIGTNVEYARLHEYGGVTRPHMIRARHARALAFPKSGLAGSLLSRTKSGKARKSAYNAGLLVFRRAVSHPGARVPARPYMRPALSESLEEIRGLFRGAVAEVLSTPKGA